MSGPLNADKLLLPAQRAELFSDYLTQTSTEMSETVLPFMFKLESDNEGETQEEVTTCRMQQDVSEWLVDEFMLLMWS